MTSPLPDFARNFLSSHLVDYARLGYRIVLHPGEKITAAGMTYTGEATPEKLEIAIGGPWENWLGILVHETCHLDQHIEEPTSFDAAESALSRITGWLDGKLNTPARLDFETVLFNESDCEMRSLRKMEEFSLPIDRSDYTRRANAYLLSYAVALRHRVWIPQPYRHDSLCSRMPSSQIMTPEAVLDGPPVVPDSDFLALLPEASPAVQLPG